MVLATLVRPPGLTGCHILLTCTVGAPIAGRISDAVVRRAKEERKGIWVPEDRLRAVWLGGLVLIPVSVTLAGFTTAYVDGTVGLVINLVCFFTNGMGVSRFSEMSGPDGAFIRWIWYSRRLELIPSMLCPLGVPRSRPLSRESLFYPSTCSR